jgi:hypothetical protein
MGYENERFSKKTLLRSRFELHDRHRVCVFASVIGPPRFKLTR